MRKIHIIGNIGKDIKIHNRSYLKESPVAQRKENIKSADYYIIGRLPHYQAQHKNTLMYPFVIIDRNKQNSCASRVCVCVKETPMDEKTAGEPSVELGLHINVTIKHTEGGETQYLICAQRPHKLPHQLIIIIH